MVDTNDSSTQHDNSDPNNGDNKPPDEEAQTHTTNPPPLRAPLRALIQDFSPVWFTWSMNTGILSTLSHTLPYPSHWLHIISTTLYILDILFFILCTTLFTLRLTTHRSTAWKEITSDVNELCFLATLPISWMTLTTLTALITSNASWAGYPFTLLSYTMWWIGSLLTLIIALQVYLLLAQHPLTTPTTLSLAIILPAVATSTAAAEGGLISIYAHHINSRLAIPVIITSYLLLGIGLILGLLIYALFLIRLLQTDYFPPSKRPTLFLLLGPAGQSATALLALSAASVMHFPSYTSPDKHTAPFFTTSSADALRAASTLLALLLVGLGIFWLIYSLLALIPTFTFPSPFSRTHNLDNPRNPHNAHNSSKSNKSSWSPTYYSTLFPTGTLNSALTLLSEEMNSPAFRVLSTGLFILLSCNLLINLGFTVRGVVRGDVLVVREDPRRKAREKRK
jgi:tellurite resistance protein TehA-like permease